MGLTGALWLYRARVWCDGYHRCILTPNVVEFSRLVAAAITYYSAIGSDSAQDPRYIDFATSLIAELQPPVPDASTYPFRSGNTTSDGFTRSSGVTHETRRDTSSTPSDSCELTSASASAVHVAVNTCTSASIGPTELELRQVRALSIALGGVAVLKKGAVDVLSVGEEVLLIHARGSPRRCGGQGDILAGCLGVALSWATQARYIILTNISCTTLIPT